MSKLALTGPKLARSLHMSPQFGVLYVNNPKVACSSIKLTLQRAECSDPGYVPPTSVHDHDASPLVTFPQIEPEVALNAARFTFSFVRNPFTRLISAYLNKIYLPQNSGRPREQAGFDKNTRPGFDEFILAICAQEPMSMNPHWRPQALNLSVDLIRYDFIGRLEQFDIDWAHVTTQTGLPAKAATGGARTHLWSVPTPEYGPQSAAAVRRAYQVDFERFGYDTDLPGT